MLRTLWSLSNSLPCRSNRLLVAPTYHEKFNCLNHPQQFGAYYRALTIHCLNWSCTMVENMDILPFALDFGAQIIALIAQVQENSNRFLAREDEMPFYIARTVISLNDSSMWRQHLAWNYDCKFQSLPCNHWRLLNWGTSLYSLQADH